MLGWVLRCIHRRGSLIRGVTSPREWSTRNKKCAPLYVEVHRHGHANMTTAVGDVQLPALHRLRLFSEEEDTGTPEEDNPLFAKFTLAKLDPGEQDEIARTFLSVDGDYSTTHATELKAMAEWANACQIKDDRPKAFNWNSGDGKRRHPDVIRQWKEKHGADKGPNAKITGCFYTAKRDVALQVEHVIPLSWMYRTQMIRECSAVAGDLHMWAMVSAEANIARRDLPINLDSKLYMPGNSSLTYMGVIDNQRRAAVARIICYAFLTYPALCYNPKQFATAAGVKYYAERVEYIIDLAIDKNTRPCPIETGINDLITEKQGQVNPFVTDFANIKTLLGDENSGLRKLLRSRMQGSDVISQTLVMRVMLNSSIFRVEKGAANDKSAAQRTIDSWQPPSLYAHNPPDRDGASEPQDDAIGSKRSRIGLG